MEEEGVDLNTKTLAFVSKIMHCFRCLCRLCKGYTSLWLVYDLRINTSLRLVWESLTNFFFNLLMHSCFGGEVKIFQWNVDLLLSRILLVPDLERRAKMHNRAALCLLFRQLLHQPNDAVDFDDVSSSTLRISVRALINALLCNYLWFIIVSRAVYRCGIWLETKDPWDKTKGKIDYHRLIEEIVNGNENPKTTASMWCELSNKRCFLFGISHVHASHNAQGE